MITISEDPIITELKRICAALSIPCYFVQANLFEANIDLDTLTKEQAPYFVLITPDQIKNKVTDANLLVRKVPIIGMFLDVVDAPDIDYTTEKVDPYIHRMMQIASEFIKAVNSSQYTHKPEPVKDFGTDKIYGRFDAHLFGAGISFEWSFNTMKGIGCN